MGSLRNIHWVLEKKLPCSKGVSCAFQVTSTWMSYSLIARSAWKAPASGQPSSSGWKGDMRLWDKSIDAFFYSTFALSHSSSSRAWMRSRSLISCTPQYVMNQMDKVLTGKPVSRSLLVTSREKSRLLRARML